MCIVAACTSADGSAGASAGAKVRVCCSVLSCFSLAAYISATAAAENTLRSQINLLCRHLCDGKTIFSFLVASSAKCGKKQKQTSAPKVLAQNWKY